MSIIISINSNHFKSNQVILKIVELLDLVNPQRLFLPFYNRIGVGGGSASSVEVQGDNKEELDFNAVQRGDAEMEQKLNRVVRACLELGRKNPILSIHDQGNYDIYC